jgi:RNA polymerase sigma-70 factor (ECF subfamily)
MNLLALMTKVLLEARIIEAISLATPYSSEARIATVTDAKFAPEHFEALLRPHVDKLYRLAYRLTGEVADAEDLVQDVLIKVYGRRDELSSLESLAPWLGRVLYNRFVDHTRQFSRQRLRTVAMDHATDLSAASLRSDLAGPEAEAELAHDISRLRRALPKLSQEHRTVLLMHDSEGYKLTEIQAITGVPTGTLKSRLHRARARLRDLVDEDGTF